MVKVSSGTEGNYLKYWAVHHIDPYIARWTRIYIYIHVINVTPNVGSSALSISNRKVCGKRFDLAWANVNYTMGILSGYI